MRYGLDVSKGTRMPTWSLSGFDDVFERLFEDFRPAVAETRLMQPRFEVEENEQAYLLSVDLPGVKKEDVSIDLTENVLTIAGERKSERSLGKFRRSFTLPASVDVEKVEANLEDGVLRLALPKFEKAKPRSIQIGSGKGGFFSKLIGANKSEEKTEDSAH